jgi:hypothetical protein
VFFLDVQSSIVLLIGVMAVTLTVSEYTSIQIESAQNNNAAHS